MYTSYNLKKEIYFMRSYVPNTREKGISIDQPSPKFFDFTTFDSIKKINCA